MSEAPQILTTEREDELLRAIHTKDTAPPYYNLRNILRIAIAEGHAADKFNRRAALCSCPEPEVASRSGAAYCSKCGKGLPWAKGGRPA